MRPADRQSYTSHPMYRPGWPDKGPRSRVQLCASHQGCAQSFGHRSSREGKVRE